MRKTTALSSRHLLCGGSWLNLYGFSTNAGYREIVARKNGRYKAAKCLVLYVDVRFWEKSRVENSNDLPSFLRNLRDMELRNLRVLFLASDKPCTYPESPDLAGLAKNYQLEIPGGIANAADVDALTNSVRELIEEYGCNVEDIRMTAPLVADVYAANDAGGQVEFYSAYAALVTKKPKPPRKEGVIPEKCALVPLLEAENFLMEQGRQGVLLEWLTLACLSKLGLELCGGWASLAQKQ